MPEVHERSGQRDEGAHRLHAHHDGLLPAAAPEAHHAQEAQSRLYVRSPPPLHSPTTQTLSSFMPFTTTSTQPSSLPP